MRFRLADVADAEQVGLLHADSWRRHYRGAYADSFLDGEWATGTAMYLWVLQQNTAAQQFYRARGAACVKTATVSPPGGDPARLIGAPRKLRMAWPDIGSLPDDGGL